MIQLDGVKAGGYHDGTVLLFNKAVGLLVVDGAGGTDLGADTALAGFQHGAVVGINGCDLGHSLCKGNVDGTALIQSQIKGVGHFLLGALFCAQTTAGAFGLVHITSLFLDGDPEVAHKALDGLHLRIRVNFNLFVLCRIHHFGGQDTGGTVQCGEGLVDLGHFAANGGLFLYNIHLKACVGNVQSGLDTGNAAANDQCPFLYRTGACGQRCVQVHLGDGGTTQNNRLLGGFFLVLMNPGALLTDVGNLHHIGVQTCLFTSFAEGIFVHTGGAGAYHHAGKTVLTDGILNQLLTGLGAHILIMCGKDYTGLLTQHFGNFFHIHGGGNVAAAPADEYAYTLHILFLTFCIF